MTALKFTLVTPSGVVSREEVSLVRIPTPCGQVELLPGHCAYVGLLSKGEVQVVTIGAGKTVSFSITEGSLECTDDQVVVLTDAVF